MIANRPPVDAQSDVCDDNDTYVSCIYLYSRGPVIATPSGRREKGRYSGRGRYSSIATSSRYIG